jgi:hypothetical protein
VLQCTAAFFGQGMSVLFGHDWRDDGVMAAVHGFAQQVEAEGADQEYFSAAPRLINVLAWPAEPRLTPNELDALSSTLQVLTLGPPLAHQGLGPTGFHRALALSDMRRKSNDLIDARLCLGGRLSEYAGFVPGVVEEAIIAAYSRKPLFLCGMLGGAAAELIRRVRGIAEPPPLPPPSFIDQAVLNTHDRAFEYLLAGYDNLARLGVKGLAESNMLTERENYELFEANALDSALDLVLKALGRLKKSEGRGA